MYGLAARHASTIGLSSCSASPMPNAPIALSAPTEAAITTGKHRDLPILPKLTINAVLLDGDAEHA